MPPPKGGEGIMFLVCPVSVRPSVHMSVSTYVGMNVCQSERLLVSPEPLVNMIPLKPLKV